MRHSVNYLYYLSDPDREVSHYGNDSENGELTHAMTHAVTHTMTHAIDSCNGQCGKLCTNYILSPFLYQIRQPGDGNEGLPENFIHKLLSRWEMMM
jgi:hypothetical protein